MTKRAVPDIYSFKCCDKKIVALTAYDYSMAKIIDQTDAVDVILVGDSLGSVIKGEKTTLSVTMDEVIYHGKCVRKGVKNALLVIDMPFLSYQVSTEQAIENAGRILKETSANAVKLEGGVHVKETIAALVNVDIPVLGHIGLTPQSYNRMGGHKIQGKEQVYKNNLAGSKEQLMLDGKAVEEAGAFSVVIEGTSEEVAAEITKELSIPTIGIASGEKNCDGEILVINDLLELSPKSPPSFVTPSVNLREIIEVSVKDYSKKIKEN